MSSTSATTISPGGRGSTRAGCRLVTRFKTNTPLNEARELPLAARIGRPERPHRVSARAPGPNRKNPMQDAVREIVVETETGKTLRILTNDLDAPAQEIADLYKRRWQIELFFRVMKQTLKITQFLGRSENAVRIQIAVALIAFLLLRAAARDHQSKARLPRTRSTRARQSDASQTTPLDSATTTPPPPTRPAPTPTPLGARHEPDSRGLDPAMTPGTGRAYKKSQRFGKRLRFSHFEALTRPWP